MIELSVFSSPESLDSCSHPSRPERRIVFDGESLKCLSITFTIFTKNGLALVNMLQYLINFISNKEGYSFQHLHNIYSYLFFS